MSPSDVAAWWGAIIATVILLWDIYKWRASQANLRVTASSNRQFVSPTLGTAQGEKFITVEVVNTGDKNTTITHLVAMCYNDWLARFWGNPTKSAFVPIPGAGQPLPYKLSPGERWLGTMDQAQVQKMVHADQLLYCGVYHTTSAKPHLVRVKFKT
jgi:hypothetical protein